MRLSILELAGGDVGRNEIRMPDDIGFSKSAKDFYLELSGKLLKGF